MTNGHNTKRTFVNRVNSSFLKGGHSATKTELKIICTSTKLTPERQQGTTIELQPWDGQ